MAWSPDGKYLAAGSADPNNPLHVWNTSSWQVVFATDPARNEPNAANIDSLSWSPDSKYLAVGLQGTTSAGIPVDHWAKVYEAATWQNTVTLTRADGVGSVAWSPKGRYIAFAANYWQAGLRSNVMLWDVFGPPSEQRNVLTIADQSDMMMALAWSPDAKSIVADFTDSANSANYGIKVWEVDKQQMILSFIAHNSEITSIAWSPDGKWLASGAEEGTVKIWDSTSGHQVATFPHSDIVNSVAWSPDSKFVATACSDRNVYIWSVK